MRARLGLALVLLLGGCANRDTTRPPPRSQANAVPDDQPSAAVGRVHELPIPRELLRYTTYELSSARASLHISSEPVDKSYCSPPDPEYVDPDEEREERDDDLVAEMMGEKPAARTPESRRKRATVLERGKVELVGIPAEWVGFRRPTRRYGEQATTYAVVARGSEVRVGAEARVECVSVFIHSQPDSSTRTVFLGILDSLGSKAPQAAPKGFTRFPFGASRVDVPDGFNFAVIYFESDIGYFHARVTAGDGSLHHFENEKYARKAKALDEAETNKQQPFHGETLFTARGRLSSPSADMRTAFVRLDPQMAIDVSTIVLSEPLPPTGAPLDDASFQALLEAVFPLLTARPEVDPDESTEPDPEAESDPDR